MDIPTFAITGMFRLDSIGLKANMQSIRAKTSRFVSKLRNRTTKKSNILCLPVYQPLPVCWLT